MLLEGPRAVVHRHGQRVPGVNYEGRSGPITTARRRAASSARLESVPINFQPKMYGANRASSG